ncbi:MAG: glycoside hydrolase family 95 protein, partial [Clostridiales bacterium]|nr:glycoside hydrolase family 95 protein [Clostridiales bacterium]
FSPFYCLYPGNRVKYHNPKDGEWVAACAEAIEARMKNNGGGTGWSSAWAVSLYARLHNSNGAYLSVKRLLEQFTFPNLFDKHPPNIFQIDGNFGAVAGINEMLVQSENGIIELLPALPNEFRDGFVSGLVAKGGIVIDMQWADKKVVSLAVRTLAPSQEKIKIRKSNLSVELFTESNIQIEN